jgi:hypothetical protein
MDKNIKEALQSLVNHMVKLGYESYVVEKTLEKGYEKLKPKKEKYDGMEKTQRKSTANRREMCDP